MNLRDILYEVYCLPFSLALMRTSLLLIRALLAALLIPIATSGYAADCPGGSMSTKECIRQLGALEKQLAALYSLKEKQLQEEFAEDDYGGGEHGSYRIEAIKSFRASNATWRQYRDTHCWFLSLQDGMSLNYAGVVAEACKVERTRERINSWKR